MYKGALASRAGLIVSALLLTTEAGAHRLQHSLSDLHWRVDDALLEVAHSFHLDDAMVLLADLGSPEGHVDPATGARLLYYVEQRFGLILDGKALELEPVGAQIDGDALWVYQEAKLKRPPDRLTVECRLLHAYHEDQQNQINWRIGQVVRSLQLSAGQPTGVLINHRAQPAQE